MVQPPHLCAAECLYSPECRCFSVQSCVLPIASALGVELPPLAWDKVNHPPPFFSAPWSSRRAPEGAQLHVQPPTELQDLELASQPAGF